MKTEFLTKLTKLAEAPYRSGSSEAHNESWAAKKNFIAGFGDAGLSISLVTRDEIQKAIDHAHETVYGEDRAARQARLAETAVELGEQDWDAFDEPAYERRGSRLK